MAIPFLPIIGGLAVVGFGYKLFKDGKLGLKPKATASLTAPIPSPGAQPVPGAPAPANVAPAVKPAVQAAASTLSPVPNRTLRRGTSGEDVKVWQGFLASRGHDPGPIDGVFGAKTEAATKAFQIAAGPGVTPDGVAGPQTFAAARGLPLVAPKGFVLNEEGTDDFVPTEAEEPIRPIVQRG